MEKWENGGLLTAVPHTYTYTPQKKNTHELLHLTPARQGQRSDSRLLKGCAFSRLTQGTS